MTPTGGDDVWISLGADVSDLSAEFQAAVDAAATAGQQIAEAFDTSASGVTAAAQAMATSMELLPIPVQAFIATLEELGNVHGLDTISEQMSALTATGLTANEAVQVLAATYEQMAASAATAAAAVEASAAAASGASAAFSGAASQMQLFDTAIGTVGDKLGEQMGLFTTYESTVAELAPSLASVPPALNQIEQASFGFTSGIEELGTQTSLFNTELQNTLIASQDVGAGITSVTASTEELTPAVESSSSALTGMGAQMIALFVTMAALKELFVSTTEEFGKFERAGEALTAISGDAEGAAKSLGDLRTLADQVAVGFDSIQNAGQRLVSIGVDLDALPGILSAIADGARAMNTSFDSAQQRFDQIAESGKLVARSLTSMNLTIEDVGNALGRQGQSIQQITDAFAKYGEAAERANVLATALYQKNASLASKTADDVVGSWQRISNAFTKAKTDLGDQVDGWKGLGDIVTVVLNVIETVATAAITMAKDAVNIVIQVVQSAVTGIVALEKASAQAIGGNFSGATATITSALATIQDLNNKAMTAINNDTAKALKTIDGLWGDHAKTVATTLGAIKDVAQQDQDAIAKTFLDQNVELDSAKQHLQDMQDAMARGAASAGMLQEAQNRLKAAYEALNGTIDAGSKKVENWNNTWQLGAQKALDAINAMDRGEKSASSTLTELNNVIENAKLHWNDVDAASQGYYTRLIDGLVHVKQSIQDIGNQKGLDQFNDSLGALEIKAEDLATKVPASFQQFMDAVANGQNFTGLENSLKKVVSDLQASLKTASDADKAGIQDAIDTASSATAGLQDMLNVLKLIGQDKSMEQLGAQITSLVSKQSEGTVTTDEWNAAMATISATLNSKVLPAMQAGVTVSPKLIAALTLLGGAWAQAGADASKGTAGIDAFAEDLAVQAESIRVKSLGISAALKDLGVTGIQAAADAFRRAGNDINVSLQGIASNATLVGPELIQDSNAIISFATNATAEMQKTGLSFDQLAQKAGLDATTLLNNIAKVAPGLAAALTAGLDPANAALALFKTQVTDSLSSADAAFTTFGQKSGDALQNILQHENDMYSKLVQMGAPLQTQLAALQQINATQQQIATATDKTGQSELQLAVNATALQLQVANLHTQTNGLADAWTQMTKAVSTAWNDLGKGIADAAVSGQNFGQAMTNVFEQLKKSIAEVVVQYLQKQLIKSLTDAGKSLDDLGGLFKTTTQVAADATHSIGGSVAAASADMSKSAEDTAFSLGSMGDEADASFSTATAAATGFGATTTTTMTTTAAVVTATGATMIATFTLLAAAVGAIAAIVGAIEQGHANTILGRIEENTRRTDLTVEGSAVYWMNASNKLDGILSTIWSPVVTLLNNISGNGDLTLNHLQDISTDIKTLVALGGMGGGGGGGGGTAASVAALLVEIEQLQQQVGLLTVQGSSVSSIMGAVNDALTTQLGIQQNIVASDQAQLDFITSQYKLGKATQEEVNTAADQLKAAQDALNSIVTTAQNGGMANTLNAIAQGPSGSTGSDIYAGMSATDTSSTAYAPSVTEALLESMTVNIAAILQLLINQFKVNAGELYATAIEESMAGALNLPTDVINKVASGIPQLVATLNGTTTDTTTATGAAVAATSGLTGATTGLTTAVTGATGAVSALNNTLQLATTGGPNVPTVPGGSSTLTGDTFGGNFSAGVDAFIAGLQAAGPFQLPGDTFSLPPMPGANLPTSSGTASGGGGLTIVLQNQGTVVGQGGMQALADTVGSTIIQRLSSIGIRATR